MTKKDLSFYNMFLILYLIDTNQTSRTTLVKNICNELLLHHGLRSFPS